jgi:hypothetical protein
LVGGNVFIPQLLDHTRDSFSASADRWTDPFFQRNSSTEIASYLSNDSRVRGA